ncbi:MAG: type IV toxin-antitoxin system AbiEi family antitoxin [Propionibacteriaceae bacterium]|jgi:predicted transcriptional regulator of viral defense system|nr:type IV toxin-antitoxin system AbiEi family antitoxin [Propionibacteriaceae bacterium]
MTTEVRAGVVRAAQAADWTLSQGLSALTTAEASKLLNVPEGHVRVRLAAPIKRGEWVSPARGLWVPVRPEHRAAGGPPGVELIADLARHFGVAYYVGWLSAASRYGAAHHAPQVFQVAVDGRVADRTVGRVRFEFNRRERAGRAPTDMVRAYGGDVPFSTPAVTALDVATDIDLAGGLDNAANVIVDLVTEAGLSGAAVAEAAKWFPVASARRVGWIIATFTDLADLEPLRQAARTEAIAPSLLHPSFPRRGSTDPAWSLVINKEVEPDT